MKKLILLLSTFVALEANSPPIPKETDWDLARRQDLNWKERLTPRNVYDFLVRQNIHNAEIVFRQIVQETGHFTSRVCKEYNNLFGMTQSTETVPPVAYYVRYKNWKESVIRYKEWQMHKFKDGWNLSDYYTFLNKVRYAKDSLYVAKLRKININKYIK